MIESEILEIVRDAADDGDRLNEIADDFRRGRDVSEVMTLLDSTNAELVAIGAWILSELTFDLYNDPDCIARLKQLTEHDNSSVRFHALSALFPALDQDDAFTRHLLRRLRNDESEGVRRAAQAVSARLSVP